MQTNPIRVTVWNEYRHERTQAAVAEIYPHGIHEALASPLRAAGHQVRTATQDEPEHGLGTSNDRLRATGHVVALVNSGRNRAVIFHSSRREPSLNRLS